MELTTIASIITAVTVIVTFMYKMYRFFRNMEEKYEEMNKLLRDDTLHILKIAILSEEMPLVDRIHAGEKYLELGGNGMIKKKYESLLTEYEKQMAEQYRI